MTDQNSEASKKAEHYIDQTARFERQKLLLPSLAALALIYTGAIGAFYWWREINSNPILSVGDFTVVVAGATIFVAMFYFAFKLLSSIFSEKKEVIPEKDRALLEPLISSSDEKAIEQYIRLSSLTGATGTATRLGLTGLPLLTVALTLIFSAIAIFDKTNGFMDLAKLTLGAFIGSFVQRTATEQSIAVSKKDD